MTAVTPPLRLNEMRQVVNARIRRELPNARGHGRDKWARWCRTGVIPTWTDPDTGTLYCNPERVFEALANLGAADPDRRAS